MMRLLLAILPWLLSAAAQAQPVYKCTADGKTSYSDRPCAKGESRALPPPPAGISPADTMGPQGGDARTLLALEKARIAREKEQAQAERTQAKQNRAAYAKRQKCAKLRLRHKWAEEDLARTVHGARHEAARIKLRRQREALAVECPV
ncbi:hypothetical protein SRABI118_01440 [Massilia sp. Bi118]|uniref:DUF4124 domain-containing protein n=1 Tax=Massilia sp. Bi118 TaxID=2822346 RepID=UPI001D331DBC|nr:DUF4124 domain-containing protein [Massilia sp. Bi118]CAH0188911.1 hypothetical protein SRABI118_01440 [Massilia sp. Bi118]